MANKEYENEVGKLKEFILTFCGSQKVNNELEVQNKKEVTIIGTPWNPVPPNDVTFLRYMAKDNEDIASRFVVDCNDTDSATFLRERAVRLRSIADKLEKLENVPQVPTGEVDGKSKFSGKNLSWLNEVSGSFFPTPPDVDSSTKDCGIPFTVQHANESLAYIEDKKWLRQCLGLDIVAGAETSFLPTQQKIVGTPSEEKDEGLPENTSTPTLCGYPIVFTDKVPFLFTQQADVYADPELFEKNDPVMVANYLNLCPQGHHLKDGKCLRDYCWCQCHKCKTDCGEKS